MPRPALIALALGLASAGPARAQTTYTYSGGVIAIPEAGPASVYPAAITVADFPATAADLTVTLSGLTHPSLDNLGVLLVKRDAPGGSVLASTILFRGVGDPTTTAAGVNLTFDDASENELPTSGPAALAGGTYRPGTDQYQSPAFAEPAPPGDGFEGGGIYPVDFEEFRGAPGDGVYELYLQDFASDPPNGPGSLAGWSLTLTPVPEPASVLLVGGLAAAGLAAVRPRRGKLSPSGTRQQW